MQIFEVVMLVCFGLSWPVSVYKSVKSKSTKGKSVVFLFAIILGYISGILGKIFNNQVNYVLILYCINLVVVSIDTALYFVNKSRERRNNIENKGQSNAHDKNELYTCKQAMGKI